MTESLKNINPEVKALWVEALRSGEYKQAIGALGRVEEDGSKSHCCLGVLCELAMKAGIDVTVEKKESYRGNEILSYNECATYPPGVVYDWAGWRRSFRMDDAELARLNDAGRTFEEIADYIEKNL